MRNILRAALILIAIIATLVSTIWMVFAPGFEPLVVFFGGVGSIVTAAATGPRRRFVISPQLIVQAISALTLALCTLWFIIMPSFEPFTGMLGALLAFGGSFLTSAEPISPDMLAFLRQFRSTRAVMLDKLRQTWLTTPPEALLSLEPPLTPLPGAVITPRMGDFRGDLPAYLAHSGGRLLILGEPGAGKTHQLTQLLAEQLHQATTSEDARLPVMLNLGAWAPTDTDFAQWAAAQLEALYELPQSVGRPWLEADYLFLLLDALDEVPAAQRPACVAAINAYAAAHPTTPIVVTCRTADYNALPHRLDLHGAVRLEPLTDEAIFAAVTPALAELLHADPALLELARLPLMLSLMARLSTAELSANPHATPTEKRRLIFDAYIAQRLAAEPHPRFSAQQVLGWLGWLGHQLRERTRSIFHLEDLTTAWLPTPGLRRRFNLLLLAVLAFLVVTSVGIRFTLTLVGDAYDTPALMGQPLYWLGSAASFLMTSGFYLLIYWLVTQQTQSHNWRRVTLRAASLLLILALVVSVPRAFAVAPVFIPEWTEVASTIRTDVTSGLGITDDLTSAQVTYIGRLFGGLIAYLTSLVSFVFAAIIGGLMVGQAARPRETSGRLIFSGRAARQGCLTGGVILLLAVIVTVLVVAAALLLTLSMGAVLGGLPLGSPMFAGIASLMSLIALRSMVIAVVFFAGTIPLAMLLLYGMQGRTIEESTSPNAATQRAISNARLAFGLVGGLTGLFACGFVVLTLGPLSTLRYALESTPQLLDTLVFIVAQGIFITLLYGVPAALIIGGRAAIEHYGVRLLLGRSGYLPTATPDFLDYAANLIFLKRVGSGYVFLHRSLHEHFITHHAPPPT